MTTHKEALTLALEALEKHGDAYLGHFDEYQFAITKVKEALAVDKESLTTEAQPAVSETNKQSTECVEPVAYVIEAKSLGAVALKLTKELQVGTQLYTTPPYVPTERQRPSRSDMTWVGLTDEEIFSSIRPFYRDDKTALSAIRITKDEYLAIEAKLKEKNTRNGGCL